MIKLIRNYFVITAKIKINSMIFSLAFPDPQYIKKTLETGHVPPEAFLYLDENGFIQNQHQVSIIYHIPRHKSNKRFTYQNNLDSILDAAILRFSTTIPNTDRINNDRKNKVYWWLHK